MVFVSVCLCLLCTCAVLCPLFTHIPFVLIAKGIGATELIKDCTRLGQVVSFCRECSKGNVELFIRVQLRHRNTL